MNSAINTNVAAPLMKSFNIAGLTSDTSPAFQISLSAIVPVGHGDFKIGCGYAWHRCHAGRACQCATCCWRPAI
jgi:hypothetical protein